MTYTEPPFGVKWKILSIGVLSFLVLVGLGVRLRTRQPPRWNASAVRAQFDGVNLEEARNPRLIFQYVLENGTDEDYVGSGYPKLKIAGKIKSTGSLRFAQPDELSVAQPIFVPAHQKTRISVLTPNYGYSQHTRGTELERWITDNMPELDGFVLYDEGSHYEIDLPNGWGKAN